MNLTASLPDWEFAWAMVMGFCLFFAVAAFLSDRLEQWADGLLSEWADHE